MHGFVLTSAHARGSQKRALGSLEFQGRSLTQVLVTELGSLEEQQVLVKPPNKLPVKTLLFLLSLALRELNPGHKEYYASALSFSYGSSFCGFVCM